MFKCQLPNGCYLQLLERRHAGAAFKALDDSRASISVFMRFADRVTTVSDMEREIAQFLRHYAANEGLWAGIFVDDQVAGSVVLNHVEWQHRSANIAYWLGQSFEGRGLVTEACRALQHYAFEDLGLHRLVLRIATENHKSHAIAARLGYQREGIQRQSYWHRDQWLDMAVYARLSTD